MCLATAHPAKFEEAVSLALPDPSMYLDLLPRTCFCCIFETCFDRRPARPPQLEALFSLEVRKVLLDNNLATIQQFILSKLKKSEAKQEKEQQSGKKDGIESALLWSAIAASVTIVGIIILRSVRK